MVGRIKEAFELIEQRVIDQYQKRRRKTLSLVIPTLITGMAMFLYGGIQTYKELNPPLGSAVHQYQELEKENKIIRNSLRRLELIDEKNRDLKNSLANLVTEYKTREETLENEITKAEEIDEVKSYNRNFILNCGAIFGGLCLFGVTSVMYGGHLTMEDYRRSIKLIDDEINKKLMKT